MSKKLFMIALLMNIIIGDDQYFIKINNNEFEFEFEDTEVANQIKSKLPFTVKMTNLNEMKFIINFQVNHLQKTKNQ